MCVCLFIFGGKGNLKSSYCLPQQVRQSTEPEDLWTDRSAPITQRRRNKVNRHYLSSFPEIFYVTRCFLFKLMFCLISWVFMCKLFNKSMFETMYFMSLFSV